MSTPASGKLQTVATIVRWTSCGAGAAVCFAAAYGFSTAEEMFEKGDEEVRAIIRALPQLAGFVVSALRSMWLAALPLCMHGCQPALQLAVLHIYREPACLLLGIAR